MEGFACELLLDNRNDFFFLHLPLLSHCSQHGAEVKLVLPQEANADIKVMLVVC